MDPPRWLGSVWDLRVRDFKGSRFRLLNMAEHEALQVEALSTQNLAPVPGTSCAGTPLGWRYIKKPSEKYS